MVVHDVLTASIIFKQAGEVGVAEGERKADMSIVGTEKGAGGVVAVGILVVCSECLVFFGEDG